MAQNFPYLFAHWAGRVLGLLLLAVYAFFMVGEGVPPLTGQTLSMYLVLAGIVMALWLEGAGSVMILIGAAIFYGLNYKESGGLPGGPVFPLFWVVGALFLVSVLARRAPAR